MFRKVVVAIAFSPTLEALLGESKRMKELFGSELYLVHVGEKKEEEEAYLQKLLAGLGLDDAATHLVWEEGSPPDRILDFCKREQADLLVAGALKKENLFNYYIGSIARRIIRKSSCSVLILVEPSVKPNPFKEIVIEGSDRHNTLKVLSAGCEIARSQKARQVHILKEIKLMGLTMALAGEEPEEEYGDKKKKLIQNEIAHVQEYLTRVDCSDLKINIKIVSGKPGHEINKFARRSGADLVVLGGPAHQLNFLDRLMSHDLEYILADIPTNLLIVH